MTVQYCDNKDEREVQFHFRHIHHQLKIALHSAVRNQLALKNYMYSIVRGEVSLNVFIHTEALLSGCHAEGRSIAW